MYALAARCLLALCLAVPAAAGAPSATTAAGEGPVVTFEGASRPTRCQEEDNVTVLLRGSGVARFRIEAVLPPYLDAITADSTAPDFTDCDMGSDPRFSFTPRTLTLFENSALALIGHTFASFWRPEVVSVRVGSEETAGLHLLQLFVKADGGREEVLVLYPADGYWRAKPLPPARLGGNAYGSSLLIGPVEEQGRPLVALSAVRFDPDGPAFDLAFAAGGSARIAVAEASAVRLALEITLAPPTADDRPFAALRSMYVRDDAGDVAVAAWQEAPGAPWASRPIMALDRVDATAARFGQIGRAHV